ncbi:MAG: VanZ family protein [Ruminococcus sp.]|nr:VanZ family protein [Ruminococcus sp.]
MVHQVVSQFYELPIEYLCVATILSCALWLVGAYLFMQKLWWKLVNIVVFVVALLLIIAITLLYRESEKTGVFLVPFSGFSVAKQHPDVYIQMALNVLLFLPFGLSMPFCVKDRVKHPVLSTIVTALLLSIIVEILQYVFSCGYSEIDDVMFNVFGTFLGTFSYIIADIIKKKSVKRKNKVG